MSMTPAQIFALMKRREHHEKVLDYRAGIIACTIANVHRGKSSKVYKPEHFMPKRDGRDKQKTPKQLHNLFKGLMYQHNQGNKK